jgi:hypothetical protein
MVAKKTGNLSSIALLIFLVSQLVVYADDSSQAEASICRTAPRVLFERHATDLGSLACLVSESGTPVGVHAVVEPICQVSIALTWLEQENDRALETPPGGKTEALKYRAPSTKTKNRRREIPAAALIDFKQSAKSR